VEANQTYPVLPGGFTVEPGSLFWEDFMTGTTKGSPRVLYVEDEKDLRVPISQILELLGYEVECAVNGRAGVTRAEEWKPDVILMDIRMPVMNGIEATEALRRNPATEQIPVFILTAYTDAKTRDACEQAGASGFFAKPLDIEKIDATIKSFLGKAA
jgi:CheY-like chemotaxis protein